MVERRSFLIMIAVAALSPAWPIAKTRAEADRDHDRDDGGGGREKNDHHDNGRDDIGTDPGRDDFDDDDETRLAREAVRQGKAHRLKDIIALVRQKYPGEIVSVSVSGTVDRLLYDIRVLSSENRLIDLQVDAKTAKIIQE